MTVNTGDNRWATANFIIAPTIAQGANFTTFTAALAAAPAGSTIAIKPGVYTENFTLPPNINLVGYLGDSIIPQVTIVGKITMTAAGSASISNIRLQTNSDFFLVVSGTEISDIFLNNCYLNCTNNTGISFTTSSASASIMCSRCSGNLATTGIAIFSSSSAGLLSFDYTFISNSGLSTTASTSSAGSIGLAWSQVDNPITTSGTAAIAINHSNIDAAPINTLALTIGGSGTNRIGHAIIQSGTATAISISTTLSAFGSEVNSSNAISIDGAGTLIYNDLSFTNTSSNVATTLTQTIRKTGPSLTIGASQDGQNNTLLVTNTSNTAGSQSVLQAAVAGSSAGDAYTVYSGPSNWSTGMDNSDSDAYVISANLTLGTGNVMRATTAGAVSFPTSISIAGGAALTSFVQGTFSPTVVGSSVAGTVNMTTQIGRYQKVGRIVTIEVAADWSTIGTATGNPLLNNLPFTVANVTNLNPLTAVSSHTNVLTTVAGAVPFLQCLLNTTTANIIYYLGATGAGNNAVITASNGFANVFSYETT